MKNKTKTDSTIERPKCCNECSRYDKDPDEPGTGYCDEWLGVKLHDDWRCHNPCVGIKGTPRVLPSRKEKKQGADNGQT